MIFKFDASARRFSWLCSLVILVAPSAALALDTVEPFGAGVSDVELYVGGEGLGRHGEAALASSFQLGYGVTDRLSAYLNGSASSQVFDDPAAGSVRTGAYVTVLDTAHVDVDLFLDVGTTDRVSGTAAGVEVNLELGRVGLFATVWEDLGDPGTPDVLAGIVETVAEGHQILVGYEPTSSVAAAGYNVVLREGVELINELSCELPRDRNDAALAVSSGVLITLR